jgi:ABC-type branched-subunit amino acid transport system substrate-binding protein
VKKVALLATAALLSACGSTVQVTGTASTVASTDGLGLPTTTTSGGPVTPGSVVPGQTPLGQAPARGGAQAPTSVGTQGPTQVLPSPGATSRVTSPIEIGFVATNVGNAQSLGLNVGQTYTDKEAYDALVKEYNANGGLAGRKIMPVYGDTDTANSDWNTQFQAACQNLTQDHHVQAVLGYVFAFMDSFEGCLAQHRVPHLYGGYQPGDKQAQKDFPSIVSVAHPTVDGVNETVLGGAMASGLLTTRSKLGILYDGCGHGDRAFKASTEPWLKAKGLQYETVYMSCAGGSGDAGAAAASVKSAQLQFAAHGVNVAFIPNAIEMLVFMENAESQGYRPAYINQGGGAALEAQGGIVPPAQMKNLHGFGWMPGIDVTQSHQPYAATPEQKACLTKLKKHGLVPAAYNDFMFAYVTCDSLDLYAKALAVTGGVSDGFRVQQALLTVMPSFRGASTYGGVYGVSALQRGGPGQYREIGFVDACSCFQYRGPVRRIPTA